MSDMPTTRQPMPLPDMQPGSVIEQEWNTFRRERPRLLAEGHEGQWVLVKGDTIIGIWDTRREACRQGYKRYLREAFLVHQLQYVEKPIRTGYWLRRLT
jgi:hypothetical protein